MGRRSLWRQPNARMVRRPGRGLSVQPGSRRPRLWRRLPGRVEREDVSPPGPGVSSLVLTQGGLEVDQRPVHVPGNLPVSAESVLLKWLVGPRGRDYLSGAGSGEAVARPRTI